MFSVPFGNVLWGDIYHLLLHRPQSSKDPRPFVSKINFKELHQHFLQVQARHREARSKKLIKAVTWWIRGVWGHIILTDQGQQSMCFLERFDLDWHGFFPYRGVSLIRINTQRGAFDRDLLWDTLVKYNYWF